MKRSKTLKKLSDEGNKINYYENFDHPGTGEIINEEDTTASQTISPTYERTENINIHSFFSDNIGKETYSSMDSSIDSIPDVATTLQNWIGFTASRYNSNPHETSIELVIRSQNISPPPTEENSKRIIHSDITFETIEGYQPQNHHDTGQQNTINAQGLPSPLNDHDLQVLSIGQNEEVSSIIN